ncbi:helix-turn-helix domain-containing protein [Aliiglaciecola sp. CAU 1673]|uniref:winged helix-turn-helix transcriptional regulator n=1 Tax=Aliiglaciecola sp. CAU 1673 TaxID=3032595 RepID=UPI0023DB5F70|nr:helix-turn-helix domain-containing protein [Aliiglaciecola sp. CAU 1673]MDF2176925.1 helix-turn-helix domain-containing protein [Aliiglaciecola sp. CAU 1673]
MNRSDCPISNALDHLGDKWSLLIIRDLALFGKRSYSALQGSAEGIATNILSSRLASLEASQLLTKAPDPADKRRQIYRLTEAGKDLLPILLEMILWSAKHNPGDLAIPDDLVQMAANDRAGLLARLRERIDSDSF